MIHDSDGNSFEDSVNHVADNATPTEGSSVEAKQDGEGQKPVTSEQKQESPKTLYIIRHGSTDMNNDTSTSQDFIRGWKDIPLNDEGRKEAQVTGDKLADMEKPTVMHHSDLDRAEETAGIISKKIGVEPTPSRELRPWDLGYLTGKTTEEALPIIKDYIENKPDERVPKGESFNEFKERAFRGVFNALRSGDSPVAIVTHHRVERLLEAWDKAGQPDDLSIDVNTFGQKGDPPAGVKTLQIGSPEAQAMTHSAEKPNPAEDFIKAAEGLGIDFTPAHKPGTQPKDYLKELAQNPDILARNVEQASNFNFAGIFGGRMTQGAKNLAEMLEKRGMSENVIKRWTGLERGAEGMWRKEIDDSAARLVDPDKKDWLPSLNFTRSEYKLGEIYKHDELYKDYPELKNFPVVFANNPPYRGAYQPKWLTGEESHIVINKNLDSAQMRKTLTHEIQHYVQDKEGFSLGVMDQETQDQVKGHLIRSLNKERVDEIIKLLKKGEGDRAKQLTQQVLSDVSRGPYRFQAHEVEARNTADRVDMDKVKRRGTLAKDTEDIPRERQILYDDRGKLRLGK